MSDIHGNDRATRLFEMARLISHYPKHFTSKAIATKLGVTKRTIHRYVEALEGLGYRVESEPSGGYFIMQHIPTVPLHLTPDEQLALVMMPFVSRSLTPAQPMNTLHAAYRSALDKLVDVTGRSNLHFDLNALDGRIVIDRSTNANQDRAASLQVLVKILDCLRHNITIRIEYHSLSSSTTTWRMFDPYYLIPHNDAMYIFGYCHLREDYRTFRISRIKNLQQTDKRFVLEDLSFDEYQGASWGIDQSGEVVAVTLRFQNHLTEYVLEEIPFRRLLSQYVDGQHRLTVCLETRINPEFMRFVLQFGSGVEVVSPTRVRDLVRMQVRAMSYGYGEDAQYSTGGVRD